MEFFRKEFRQKDFEKIKITRSLNDLKKISSEILKGRIKGRTIVKVI